MMRILMFADAPKMAPTLSQFIVTRVKVVTLAANVERAIFWLYRNVSAFRAFLMKAFFELLHKVRASFRLRVDEIWAWAVKIHKSISR
jgi:hypothetical protein